MAGIGLVSPGVKVREVDLTVGRIDSISDQTGAIVGPFERGPVLEPLLIENEQDMIDLFGKPKSNDRQYEYWYTAANYLQYGGILRVVRADGANLNNANVGGMPTTHPTGIGSTSSLKIKSFEDYQNNYEDNVSYRLAARNPGAYANGMKVAYIDGAADQQLHVTPPCGCKRYCWYGGYTTYQWNNRRPWHNINRRWISSRCCHWYWCKYS